MVGLNLFQLRCASLGRALQTMGEDRRCFRNHKPLSDRWSRSFTFPTPHLPPRRRACRCRGPVSPCVASSTDRMTVVAGDSQWQTGFAEMHGNRTGWICVPFLKRRWHRGVQVERGTVPIPSSGQKRCFGPKCWRGGFSFAFGWTGQTVERTLILIQEVPKKLPPFHASRTWVSSSAFRTPCPNPSVSGMCSWFFRHADCIAIFRN